MADQTALLFETLNEVRERQRTMLARAHFQRARARATRAEAIRMREDARRSLSAPPQPAMQEHQ